MRLSRKSSARGLTLTMSLILSASLVTDGWPGGQPGQHAFGKITTLARVPVAPGFPESLVVSGHRIYVAGPAGPLLAAGPSTLSVFDRETGALVTTINVTGENLTLPHALVNVAVDGQGRIDAVSSQLGLIRFTKHGLQYVQESYGAPLPDLPRCDDVPRGTACSPTIIDLPPLANDLVFDDDGFAYVTDSFQATIFRYPPGGGMPKIWFQSAKLEGAPFDTNGIRFDPDREHAFIAVSSSFADPNRGTIYKLRLRHKPTEHDLDGVYEYTAGEFLDQPAFDSRGNRYVSLAIANQISLLTPHGRVIRRFESGRRDEIPLDAPAALAFDSRTRSLLIVNHAVFSGTTANFAVLRVFVGDPGNPLDRPIVHSCPSTRAIGSLASGRRSLGASSHAEGTDRLGPRSDGPYRERRRACGR